MSQSAIRVDGLSKEYFVGSSEPAHSTFYDLLTSAIKAPWRKMSGTSSMPSGDQSFWALRDINFEVQAGEVVGVIGRNGAGKSSLLKILSRITAPTKGRIEVRGRLASLLEVGTGFHPELSGRENVFLNGAILGMTRSEVARKFDEIVNFAEIGKFVDTPVKRYSSGMYVRLAFAVAAHLETDVLLVDEVLAVGDAAFQRKSLGKMSDVARGGRTVLFVSHNLGAVRNLCSRALVFDRGELSFDGATEDGLARYEKAFSAGGGLVAHASFSGPLADQLRITELTCIQNDEAVSVIDPLSPFSIELKGVSLRDFPAIELKIGLFRDGIFVASCHDTPREAPLQEGEFTSRFQIPGDVFRPGRYTIGVGISSGQSWTWGAEVAALDFSENVSGRSAERMRGIVSIPYTAQRIQ